jgi:hypothetical protein
MQNRLDGAAEAQAASEKQLAELHSAIAAERVARPESVNLLSFFSASSKRLLFLFFLSRSLGSTQRVTRSIGYREENVNCAARRTRSVWRM